MASWSVALLRSPPTMAPTFKLPIAHPAIQASKVPDTKPAALTRKKRGIFCRIKAWLTGPSYAAGTTSIRPTKVPCMPPIIVQLRATGHAAVATSSKAPSPCAQPSKLPSQATIPRQQPVGAKMSAEQPRPATSMTSCADNKAEAHQTHRAARGMAPQLTAVAQPASAPTTVPALPPPAPAPSAITEQQCAQNHFILYPPSSDAPVVHASAATPMQLPRTGLHPQPAPTPMVQLPNTQQPALPASCSTPQAPQSPAVSWAALLLDSPDSPCPSHLEPPQLPAHSTPQPPLAPVMPWVALLASPDSPLPVSPIRHVADSPAQPLQASTPCPSPSLSPAAQQPQLLSQPPTTGSAHSAPSPAEELQTSLLADDDYQLDFTADVNLVLQALGLPPCSPSPAPSSPAQQVEMPSAAASPAAMPSATSSPAAMLSTTSSPAASSTCSEVTPGNLAWRLTPFTVGPGTTAVTPVGAPSFQWDLSPPDSSLQTPRIMHRSFDYEEANGDSHMLAPQPWYLSPFPTFDSPCRKARTSRFRRAREAIMAAAC